MPPPPTGDPFLRRADSGPVRYYENEADMPPAMRARRAEERHVLAQARSRFDELLLTLAGAGWPAPAVELVRAHPPHASLGRVECPTCDGDAWPCWTITTAAGPT